MTMRISILTILFCLLFFSSNAQNSFFGFRYVLSDYGHLNKVFNESGYPSLTEGTYIGCFGSSMRKKKTSAGIEFYGALPNSNLNGSTNTSKLNIFGILVNSKTALNRSTKSILSVVFNFGYQRTDLLFYNEDQVKDLSAILNNKELSINSFKKNELLIQLGLGYDWISNSGFGLGLEGGYQAGFGKWKYLNLNYPTFPKAPFGQFYGTVKIYLGKKKNKKEKIEKKTPMEPTGPMTWVK